MTPDCFPKSLLWTLAKNDGDLEMKKHTKTLHRKLKH